MVVESPVTPGKCGLALFFQCCHSLSSSPHLYLYILIPVVPTWILQKCCLNVNIKRCTHIYNKTTDIWTFTQTNGHTIECNLN